MIDQIKKSGDFMENMRTLVNNYLNKIKISYKCHRLHDIPKEEAINLGRELEKIINSNLDYLLTDSLIDYMCDSGVDMKLCLESVHINYYRRLCLLMSYFDTLFMHADRKREVITVRKEYFEALDDDMKHAIYYVLVNEDVLREKGEMPSSKYYLDFNNIIHIIFANYLMNYRNDNIYEMCDIVLKNPKELIDGLLVNGALDIFYDQDGNVDSRMRLSRICEFVGSKFNRDTREIK